MNPPVITRPTVTAALEHTEKVPLTQPRRCPHTTFGKTALEQPDTGSRGLSTGGGQQDLGTAALPLRKPSNLSESLFSHLQAGGVMTSEVPFLTLYQALKPKKAAADPGRAGAWGPHLDQDPLHVQPPQH